MSSQLELPTFFYIAAGLIVALIVESIYRRRESWALPVVVVCLMTIGWYFADLFISPQVYANIPEDRLDFCYIQISIFLVCYRALVPPVTRRMTRTALSSLQPTEYLKPETLLVGATVIWAVLLAYGTFRMRGDIVGALLPLDARGGVNMWSRGAAGDAGDAGFIVSTASYLYILVCSAFGMLLVFVRNWPARGYLICMIAISWPFFLLTGTRSIFLAVCVPGLLSYLLFGANPVSLRLVIMAIAFAMLNTLFLAVVTFRDVGLAGYVEKKESGELEEREMKHQGLNMIEELYWVDLFSETHDPAWGTRYLVEALNVVPRAIWADKPTLGIDYAVWRGFGGGDSDIGVVATISSGFIGGGVLNFGPYLGPPVVSLLMALWTGLLARLWCQRASILRCFVFLAGLGLTFNLGRDITLLVLWPMVFGMMLIAIVARITRKPPDERPDYPPSTTIATS